MIVHFFAESIGQASEAPNLHSHGEVLAFYVRRAHMLGIGIAAHNLHFAADTGRR
jgi:hypothetical protein